MIMRKNKLYLTLIITGLVLLSCDKKREIWTSEQANEWYAKQPWLVGANYIPSTAINQLEMWQAESFDPKRIDQELGWAENIGMNTMRVYLHDLLHKQDAKGFYKRMNIFLGIAEKHHIKILFVLFDSCWNPFPVLGKQKPPRPFVHNSGWVQSPGREALEDSAQYARLEKYVRETISEFKNDERILGWDLWNEPDNMTGQAFGAVETKDKVKLIFPLLKKIFIWARESNPSQPLTSGLWIGDWSDPKKMLPMHKMQIEQSDVISFHNYDKPKDLLKVIKQLQRYGKPLLCTEYMARTNGSTFEGFLPIGQKYKIAMFNWGLVDGKTQTKYDWYSWINKYDSEPKVWFHDVFRNNGVAYNKTETDLIKKLTSEVNNK